MQVIILKFWAYLNFEQKLPDVEWIRVILFYCRGYNMFVNKTDQYFVNTLETV